MSTEGGTGVLERSDTRLDEADAHPWATVLYNDPVNTFAHVIACCVRIVSCSREQAEVHASQVHYEGKSSVYVGSREQAEQYAAAFSAAHIWCRAETT